MEANVVIFSKDRACQLDLLLRSMNRFWLQFHKTEVHVLYTYSSDRFREGYKALKGRCHFGNVTYHLQEDFQRDLIRIIYPKYPHTVFFVDDDMFRGVWDDTETVPFDTEVCFSLRLGANITRSLILGRNIEQPELNVMDYLASFRWVRADADFGYPMSLDGHIFRTKFIYPLLCDLEYNSPNQLETVLSDETVYQPDMSCYAQSVLFNLALNQVQTDWQLPHGDVSAEYLNEQYLNGLRIDLMPFEYFKNTACHEIQPVTFIKRIG